MEFIREAEDEGEAMVSTETKDQGACNIFTNMLTTNLDDIVVNESYNINIIETAHASSANQNVNDSDDRASHDEFTSHGYASHDENLSHDDSLSHDDTSHDDNFSQTSQASYHLDSCDTDTYDQSNSMSLPSELRFSSLDQSDSLSLPSDVKGSDSLHSGLSEDDLLEGERLYLQSISNIGDGDVDSFVDNVVEPLLFEAQTKSLHITAKNAEALSSASEPFVTSEEAKEDDAVTTDLDDTQKGKVDSNVSVDVLLVSSQDNGITHKITQDFQESKELCIGSDFNNGETEEVPVVVKMKTSYDLEEHDFPFIDDEQDEIEPSSCILATVESDEEKGKKIADAELGCLPNGSAVVYSAEFSETASACQNAESESSEKLVSENDYLITEVTEEFEEIKEEDMFDDIPYYLHRRLIDGDIRRKKETELYTALANVLSTSPVSAQSRPGRSLKRPQNMQVQQLKADEIPFQPPPSSAAKRTPSASPGRSPGRISPGGLTLDFSTGGRRSRTLSGSSHSRSPSGGRNRMEVINYHKLPKKDNFSSVDDTASSPKEEGFFSPIPKPKQTTLDKTKVGEKSSQCEEVTKTAVNGDKSADSEKGDLKKTKSSAVKERTAAKIVKQDSVQSEGSLNLSEANSGDTAVELSDNFNVEECKHMLTSNLKSRKIDSKRKGSLDIKIEFTPKSILSKKSLAKRRFSEGAGIYHKTVYEEDFDMLTQTELKLPVSFSVEPEMKMVKESNIGEFATDSLTRHSGALRKTKPKLSELNTKGKSYEEQEWEDLIQKLRKEDDSSPDDLQPSDLLRPLDETVRTKSSGDSRRSMHDYYYDLDPEPSYTAASILLSQSYYQNYTTHHDCVDSNFSTFKATPSISPAGSRSSTSLSSLGDSSGAITMSLSHDTEDIQMEEKSLADYAFDILEAENDDSAAQHHAMIRRNISPCRLKEYTTQSCKEFRVHSNSEDDDFDIVNKRHSYHGETVESAISKQRRKLLEPKRVSFHETVEEIQSEPYPSSSSSDEKQSDKDSPDMPAADDSGTTYEAGNSEKVDNLSEAFEKELDSENFVEIPLTREEEDSDGSRGSGSRGGRSGSESDDESECSDEGDLDKTNEFLKFARSLADSGKESTADSGVGESMTNTTEPSPSESLKKLEHLPKTPEQDSDLHESSECGNFGESSIEYVKDVSQSYEDVSSSSSSNSDDIAAEKNKRPSIDPLESLEQLHDSYVSSDEENFDGEPVMDAD